MATTEHFYTGNGSTTTYAYTFPYYKTSDIKVTWDGALKTESTHYNVTGTNIVFTSGNVPGNNVVIHIYRETDVDTSKATFAPGSSIRATDLNNQGTQLLYAAQEVQGQQLIAGDIKDGAITSAKILDGTIATADIADNAITAAKLATSSIDATNLAANSVGASELADNSVDTAAIVDDAVTSAKIATGAVIADGLASNAVTTAKIYNDAVTTAKIDDDAVTAAKIASNAITAAKIATDAITEAKILDANVTTNKIANDAVTSDKLANSINAAITANTAKTGNATHTGEVTGATALTIADGAVVTDRIANNAVTTAKIPDNAITTAKLADAELSTLAGMPSATASILADNTNLTATIAEINTVVDGKSVQTTISDTDAAYPTSGAVIDYVTAQISPLGGLKVIADEDNFPSIPAAGVVISIADVDGIVINSSGVCTTARTAGNGSDNVTINGFPTALRSKTLSGSLGLMVSSTGSNNTYNYHKLLGKEDDIEQLSQDISDFGNRYRVASSAPSSDNDAGDLYFNTSANKLYTYNASTSTWDEAQSIGNFYISTFSESFDNSRTAFTVSNAPNYAQQLLISINGVVQKPNAGTGQPSEGFTLSGSTVTFSSAPVSGSNYFVIVLGSSVNIGTPSDNTVTSAILQNGSVIKAKIGADAVDGTKIEDDAIAAEHLASNAVVTASIVDDAVTADKLANSINTEISANTAKVTNATHTGEVTGATALTIADDVVDEANLKVSNSPTNGYYLQAQSGNTGGLTWAAVSQYTTPLTTEGDILYRDGSGDQRLAKGTAGQALIMNSGATAPEWGAAGATIANDANNRVITADGSAGLNGEANLTFDGSTLTNTGNTISQGYESPATVAANWSIGANNNAMFPGPMTVASGVTVTVPANRTLTVV